jgi:hypothetical protein
MTQRIPCPGCGKALRIPDGVTDPWLSCPSCLAQFPNPRASASIQTTPSPPAAGIRTAPSPPVPKTTCPACGETIESTWRYCPFCQEDLRGPGGPRRIAGTDVDVRRDQRGTSVFLILLAVLGGLGFGYGLLGSLAGLSDGTAWPLVLFLAVVLGIGVFSAARVYNKPQPPAGARGVGRVVVHTLAGIGCLVGTLGLLGFASFVVFLVVCLVNPPRFH